MSGVARAVGSRSSFVSGGRGVRPRRPCRLAVLLVGHLQDPALAARRPRKSDARTRTGTDPRGRTAGRGDPVALPPDGPRPPTSRRRHRSGQPRPQRRGCRNRPRHVRPVPPHRLHRRELTHDHRPLPARRAVHYRDYAITHGVPADAVLTETAATNTAENIQLTRRLLDSRGVTVASVNPDVPALRAATPLCHLPQTLARGARPVPSVPSAWTTTWQ